MNTILVWYSNDLVFRTVNRHEPNRNRPELNRIVLVIVLSKTALNRTFDIFRFQLRGTGRNRTWVVATKGPLLLSYLVIDLHCWRFVCSCLWKPYKGVFYFGFLCKFTPNQFHGHWSNLLNWHPCTYLYWAMK